MEARARMLKRFAVILTVVLALSGNAWAGPYEDGLAAFQRGDYSTALTEYRKAAEKGDVRAQMNLGTMYDNGQGVSQDYRQAVKWYGRAAEQGNATAQFNLGESVAVGI